MRVPLSLLATTEFGGGLVAAAVRQFRNPQAGRRWRTGRADRRRRRPSSVLRG